MSRRNYEERKRIKKSKMGNKTLTSKQKIQRLFLIILIVSIFFTTLKNNYSNSKLKTEGTRITATVTDKSSLGRLNHYVYYEFNINNQKFKGRSFSRVEYDKYKIGSSICVVYLPSNPNINKSCYHVD